MNYYFKAGQLAKALSKAVSHSQGSLMALNSYFLLDFKEHDLTIYASNGSAFFKTGVEYSQPDLITGGTKLLVVAKEMTAIIKAFAPEAEVTIEVTPKQFLLLCGKSKYNLETLGADEFFGTELVDDKAGGSRMIIDYAEILHLFQTAYPFIVERSEREYRPMLAGFRFMVKNNEVTVTATNSHYLCEVVGKCTDGEHWGEVQLPAEIYGYLKDSFDSGKITISHKESEGRQLGIYIQDGTSILYHPVIIDLFVDYSNKIPTSWVTRMEVDVDEFKTALKRVMLISKISQFEFKSSITEVVRLTKRGDELSIETLSKGGAAKNKGRETIEVSGEGDFVAGFKPQFLLDILSSIQAPTMIMGVANTLTSMSITGADGTPFIILMPVRIDEDIGAIVVKNEASFNELVAGMKPEGKKKRRRKRG